MSRVYIKRGVEFLFFSKFTLYALFFVYGITAFDDAPGDDLSSSYMACVLFLKGETEHLYDFHNVFFQIVNSAAWIEAAVDTKFSGFLHPYVQIPLWGWGLQPLCGNFSFQSFKIIFLACSLLSIIITIEITARAWAPLFLQKLPLTILLISLAMTTPFKYAMWLIQTHSLFMTMIIAALLLSTRKRDYLAGFLLALACAVKITPGFIALYWFVVGRGKSVKWFIINLFIIIIFSILVSGTEMFLDYIHSMRRVADVLLLSFNNQSFAAWYAYSHAQMNELWNWRIHTVPIILKYGSILLCVVGVMFCGVLARRNPNKDSLAVSIALIFITIFSPIAWTHYYIMILPAVMVTVNIKRWVYSPLLILIFLLNTEPLAVNPIMPYVGTITVIRSHFFSAMLLCGYGVGELLREVSKTAAGN